jgi:hypothetical protein
MLLHGVTSQMLRNNKNLVMSIITLNNPASLHKCIPCFKYNTHMFLMLHSHVSLRACSCCTYSVSYMLRKLCFSYSFTLLHWSVSHVLLRDVSLKYCRFQIMKWPCCKDTFHMWNRWCFISCINSVSPVSYMMFHMFHCYVSHVHEMMLMLKIKKLC